jgi:hypothetical protein
MRTYELAATPAGRLRLAALSAAIALCAGSYTSMYAAAPAQAPADAAPSAAQAVSAPPEPSAPSDPPAAEGVSAPATQTAAVPPNPAAAKGAKLKKVKAVKKKKEKPPKLIPVHIRQGTLTVDGWTGKAEMNYDIADLKYIYVWAPGVGTVVVSTTKFPMAIEQKTAFNGNNLTLDAAGHSVQISSEQRLLKSKQPISAWVYVDTSFRHHSAYPEMGYGAGKDAPYAWPGASQAPVESVGAVAPPPLPAGLRPAMAKPACTPAAPGTSLAAPAASCAPNPAPKPASPPTLAPVDSTTSLSSNAPAAGPAVSATVQ